jgi:IS1 family transposase
VVFAKECYCYFLNRHLHLDGLVWVVSNNLKVRKLKVVNVLLGRIDLELGKGSRLSLQLLLQSLHMIQVDMGIPDGVNEVTRFATGYLRHHVGEKSVGSNIERDTQSHVGTTLIHLARNFILDRIHLKWSKASGQVS